MARGLDIEASVCNEERNQTLNYIGIEFYIMGVTRATSTHHLCKYDVAEVLRLGIQQDADPYTLLAGLQRKKTSKIHLSAGLEGRQKDMKEPEANSKDMA